ncbi:hypothetical protein M8C21_004462 [Ambrosia artemisiifolia]|uniref:Uncharacterized protein n=1 Tax=Ambrosia artemisiifolia TaxID=4212 RepID=A0AAD5G418_AMBAR|nr:hypothetical protein M8C21_004462 [Ambrosia artemisiifolia]
MDTHRYNQRVAEHQTETRVPELKTGLPIEKQCMLVYSQTLFYEVRKEIQKGLLLCFITKQDEVDGVKVYSVTHLDKRSDVVNEYTIYKSRCNPGELYYGSLEAKCAPQICV